MSSKFSSLLFIMIAPLLAFAQKETVQNASIPKDAPVNVQMSDFKNNVLNNEIVVFKSKANGKEYEIGRAHV